MICTAPQNFDSKDGGTVNGETLGCGVLDSGCSKTVCGADWIETYLDTLDENEMKEVKFEESDSKFKFGNSQVYQSLGRVTFPAVLGSKNVMITADIVNTDVPLLLSKKTMKKAKTIIDFNNDSVSMFGEKVKLLYTSKGGHYCVSLNKKVDVKYEVNKVNKVYFVNIKKIKKLSEDEKCKVAMKVHKQFCHCSGKRLRKLFVDAGVTDKEMLKLVEEVRGTCDICVKYGSTPPKPVVTMPNAKTFNEHIAMDLKDINSKHVLHLIDHMTRFSAACVVPSKCKDVIVAAVLRIWISVFGCPGKILSDNGGEFSNDDFREMGEKLNTRITTTAAESPWSNGINERHNGILGEMIYKTMEDANCSLDVAISWAVCAKNSLSNINGYSPQQLVFGKNLSLPSVLHDKLPALESKCYSETMRKNLNAMHSARKSFIEAESSEKLRRALRSKTRTHTGKIFSVGESVYYKRQNCGNVWKGPGKVIGVDGEVIMIRHGGQGVRVHSSMVKVENSEFVSDEEGQIRDGESEEENGAVKQVISKENHVEKDVSDGGVKRAENHETKETEPVVTGPLSLPETNGHNNQYNDNETVTEETVTDDAGRVESVEAAGGTENSSRGKLPAVKTNVEIKPMGSEVWRNVKIISRGGKATGKYARWLNIQDKETLETDCIDWDTIEEWKEVPPEEVLISETCSLDIVLESKLAEMEKWREYEVFTEVKNEGQRAITTRWVCSEKNGKVKSRLVARGYEDYEMKERVDSPTCSKSNLRLAVAVTSFKEWRINSLDFRSAFLQGEEVTGDIYIKPPKEANTKCLWKLKKHVYGLKQASRKWYNRVSAELKDSGMTKSKLDEALFYLRDDENELKGLVAGHVDDFFWSGDSDLQGKVINRLRDTFHISTDLHDSFNFIGLDFNQTRNCIEIDQSIYAEGIEFVPCLNKTDKFRLLTEEEKEPLRSAIGQLCWLANQTRPDIAYEVCQLSVRYNNAQVLDIVNANKTIKKVKHNKLILKYPKLKFNDKVILKVFSDASFNNLPNGGSQGGFVIFLCDHLNNASLIQWQSKRIRRVAKSTLAAECLALEDAVDAGFYLKCVVTELLGLAPENVELRCYIDNKSLHDNLHSTTNVKEEKRLVLDIALLKEMMEKEEITSVEFVESKEQLADCLTKQGASAELLRGVLASGNLSNPMTG